mgnify:CR=1 FL=1|jgi:methionyl-tRNA formyltransferase
MNVHLYTTDKSVFNLLKVLPKKEQIRVTAIVVPENRISTKKVIELTTNVKDISVHVQTKEGDLLEELPSADIAISWFYSQIIPPNILQSYTYGILNMHGGKIPQYRGASVLQWAIINGEPDLGVTWHTMVEEVDAGPIWAESSVPILPEDNALNLRELLIKEGIQIFPKAWNDCIDPRKTGKITDLTKGQRYPQRKPEDGRILPGMTIAQVKNTVRSLVKPWPEPTVKVGGLWEAIKGVSMFNIDGSVEYETLGGGVIYLVLVNNVVVKRKGDNI